MSCIHHIFQHEVIKLYCLTIWLLVCHHQSKRLIRLVVFSSCLTGNTFHFLWLLPIQTPWGILGCLSIERLNQVWNNSFPRSKQVGPSLVKSHLQTHSYLLYPRTIALTHLIQWSYWMSICRRSRWFYCAWEWIDLWVCWWWLSHLGKVPCLRSKAIAHTCDV